MTTIKATCGSCGEVSLSPEDIELRVDRRDAEASFYAFTCPTCLEIVRKPANDRVVRLLITGGVVVQELRPQPRFTGPRLTHDDLLDFHQLLEDDSWFDKLAALARG